MCMLLPRECQCIYMFAKSVNRMQIVSVEVLLYQALFLFAGGLWSVALSHNAHAKEAFFNAQRILSAN